MSVISYPERGGIPPAAWSSGNLAKEYQIRWFDRLGNVIKTSQAISGQSVFSPSVPVVSGLSNGRWSESATSVTRDIDIVPIYDVTDGKCHVFLDASSLVGLTATVKLTKTDGSTLLIEWGDGTTEESTATGAVTLTHLYAAGSYEVKFSITSGTGNFTMGHGTTGNPFFAGVSVTELWMRSTSTTIPAYSLNGTAFRTMAAIVGANGVTSIEASALVACYALKQCAVPECLTIGPNAFQTCYIMTAFFAPKCTTVSAAGLIACTMLRVLSLPKCTDFWENAAQFCGALEYVWLPECLTIGASSFAACYSLKEIYIDACVSIGANAFLSDSGIFIVYAPLCNTIGAAALSGCAALASLSLPSVVTIGAQSIQSCRSLSVITFGANCATISSLAIDSARNLRTLRIEAAVPPTLASVASLADFDPRLVIQVPAASLDAYQAATNWSAFSARMVGY